MTCLRPSEYCSSIPLIVSMAAVNLQTHASSAYQSQGTCWHIFVSARREQHVGIALNLIADICYCPCPAYELKMRVSSEAKSSINELQHRSQVDPMSATHAHSHPILTLHWTYSNYQANEQKLWTPCDTSIKLEQVLHKPGHRLFMLYSSQVL